MSSERDGTFGYLIVDVARLMTERFDARVRALGLSRAQWRLMAALYRAEGCNQAQLADALDVAPISLARLVDRMERAGWVERRAVPEDRRAWRLYLSEKAHEVRPELRRLSDATQAEALAGLDAATRQALLEGLASAKARLLEAREDAAARPKPAMRRG